MAVKSLAIKYRPQTFDDVTEQSAVKTILLQQLDTNTTKNAYLFCGGAGTGKTTTARIFANELNKGQGNAIELDAASNNSVDDVREIIQQAKTKAIDSEYKIFILDECHMLSNGAWNAMLKLIEEPPAKSVFIFCTTDPQKISKTILSRVQRYDFQRISQKGIFTRLCNIMAMEHLPEPDMDAIEYIAKLADGGMRDAITLMDKCLAYSTDLTLENVVTALGVADYNTLFTLTDAILGARNNVIIECIEDVHMSGKDLKQFIHTYMNFLLDLCKYSITGNFKYVSIPSTYSADLDAYGDAEFADIRDLLDVVVNLNANLRWETNPKVMIEATLII